MNSKIDQLAVSAIRCLLLDEITKANSGHPGMALDIAPAMYALFKYHLVADPKNPKWINRDRFILSSGHNSALLYAMLHVAGYDVTIDDLKQFRQLNSRTPGHPEVGLTAGVDATAGPLGQGIGQAVGMAMAEEKIRASYPEGERLMNHYTYCLCGDGCLEEGISQEAISLAGHLKLNKLILIYDENTSTLDGPTSNSMTEDEKKRFEAAEWNVLEVEDGNDIEAINLALSAAKKSSKPTMILVHTVIGYGSQNAGSHKTHGSPLKADDVKATKAAFGYSYPEFSVPEEVYQELRDSFAARGEKAFKAYKKEILAYAEDHLQAFQDFNNAFARNIDGYDLISPELKESEATRNASERFLHRLVEAVPFTFGGSADVASSVKTAIPGDPGFSFEHRDAKNINFGIREFAMAAIQNGILLHGGLIPYIGSFLVFADYFKNAIRMACLEQVPAIYLLSHDSIAVGEDGPTHEPIEQLAMLRTIPGMDVIRPADDREMFGAWKLALASKDHPTALILTRQNLPLEEGSSEEAVAQGGYVISKAKTQAEWQIIASGSEVSLAIAVQKDFSEKGISIEVVSMPSTNRFDRLNKEEKQKVLSLPRSKRIAIEMAAGDTWYKYADHVISLDEYGRSGPADAVMAYFGFTPEEVAKKVEAIVKGE